MCKKGERGIKIPVFLNIWESTALSCVIVEEASVDMGKEQKLALNLTGEQEGKHLLFIESKKRE